MPETHRDEIEKLEALYASNPAGRVFTHLAEAYRKAGEPIRAKEILESGLERHPDYPGAHVVLGRVLLDSGDRDAAAGAFRRVLELDRHNLIALRALGDLAVETGRFEEARHYFGELIQMDPADPEIAGRLEALPEEPAWAIPGDEAEFALQEPEPSSAPVEEPRAEQAEPPPEAPQAVESGREPARQPGRAAEALEAWVESLNVLEPDLVAPELPGFVANDMAAGLPEPERFEPELAETVNDMAAGLPEPERIEPEVAETVVAAAPVPLLAAEAPPILLGTPAPPGAVEAETFVPSSVPDAVAAAPGAEEAAAEEAAAEEAAAEEATAEGAGVEGPPVPETPAEEAGVEAEEAGMFAEPMLEGELASAWWGDVQVHGTVPDPVEWVSQEDWERIAAYGAWTGAAGEESVEPVPPIEAGWSGSERDEDADEVATETLAEVYAAQGFRSEAAEIYRKLLRRRPDDARLLARLDALEAEPRGLSPDVGFVAASGAAEVEAGEAWLEHVESAWPGAEEVAVAGPTPYAWVDAAAGAEADEGLTIGERLRGVLAWQPESAPEPEPTILLEEVAPEPLEPEAPVVPAKVRRATAGTVPPAAAGGEEDLEMFRSWLKSLRK